MGPFTMWAGSEPPCFEWVGWGGVFYLGHVNPLPLRVEPGSLRCRAAALAISAKSPSVAASLKKQTEILFRLIYCEKKILFWLKKQAEKDGLITHKFTLSTNTIMHVPTIDATNLKSTKATTEPEKLIRGKKKMIDRSLSFYYTDFTWQDTPAASLDTSR